MRALINVILPKNQDGHFIDVREFRSILRTMGLRPVDMPLDEEPEGEPKIHDYCLTRAAPIFERMPDKTPEDLEKKEWSKKNVIFASDLANSNTLFMVTVHTESEYRFRLLNSRIEDLQDGCRDLVLRIQAHASQHPERRLQVEGDIKLFEHGLEESTIVGKVVQSKWKTARELARRDVLVTTVGIIMFTIFLVLSVLPLFPSGSPWHSLMERLSTAMFTATIVSAISIYYVARYVTPIIQWTASYDKKL